MLIDNTNNFKHFIYMNEDDTIRTAIHHQDKLMDEKQQIYLPIISEPDFQKEVKQLHDNHKELHFTCQTQNNTMTFIYDYPHGWAYAKATNPNK